LPCPDLTTTEGAALVDAIRAYWHSCSDTLGNV
jgi:hypothetical protein